MERAVHFPGSAAPSDTVDSESVVGVTPGDSGVVIGYQVDEFTHAWLAKHFITHLHASTHFPLKPCYEDYSIL